MFACKCGSRRFYAHQVCQLDVICDEGGTFVANAKEGDTSASIYEGMRLWRLLGNPSKPR